MAFCPENSHLIQSNWSDILPQSSKYKLLRKPITLIVDIRLLQTVKLLRENKQRDVKKGRDEGNCTILWSRLLLNKEGQDSHNSISHFWYPWPSEVLERLKKWISSRDWLRHFACKNLNLLCWPDGGYHARELMKCSNSKLI